jgi:hypothetical protein
MTISYRTLTQSQYNTQRYDFARIFEGYLGVLYDDSEKLATIGTGFNVEVENVRNAVIDEITKEAKNSAGFAGLRTDLDKITLHLLPPLLLHSSIRR